MSFIVHYHCTFEAHKFYHYSMSDLIVCPIYAGQRIRKHTNVVGNIRIYMYIYIALRQIAGQLNMEYPFTFFHA